jgi:hypothetical protein
MGVPAVDLFSLLGGDQDLGARAPNLNDGLHLSGRWAREGRKEGVGERGEGGCGVWGAELLLLLLLLVMMVMMLRLSDVTCPLPPTSHRGNALVLEAVLAAIREHYPEVAPESIPMQVSRGGRRGEEREMGVGVEGKRGCVCLLLAAETIIISPTARINLRGIGAGAGALWAGGHHQGYRGERGECMGGLGRMFAFVVLVVDIDVLSPISAHKTGGMNSTEDSSGL